MNPTKSISGDTPERPITPNISVTEKKKQEVVFCSHDWYDVACLTQCHRCGLAFSRFFKCPYLYRDMVISNTSILAVFRCPFNERLMSVDITETVSSLLRRHGYARDNLLPVLSAISSRFVFDYETRHKAKENLILHLNNELISLLKQENSYAKDPLRELVKLI